jgi:predicted glycosyltransferase
MNVKHSAKKKIWIDLDNSPHVVFFKPIIEEIKKNGTEIVITARDCFQVCELADLFNLQYKRIGRHYGKNKLLKVIGLFLRFLKLIPFVLNEKPVLALSLGSRVQELFDKVFGITTVTIFDYEYAKDLIFIHPSWLIAPEIIPDDAFKHKKNRLLKYPGIKEDVYIHNFKPDPSIKQMLGVNEKELLITLRPPATEAHYHNHQSEELFKRAIDFLGQKQNTRMVVLPRNEKQGTIIQDMWTEMCKNKKILIPDHVVDGLNLIWHSDLVISGGGTMNREAAALSVPVYSIFKGKIGAVDRFLADSGRLTLIENVEDIQNKIILGHRHRPLKPENINSPAMKKILDHISLIMESG